jgi:tRNA dimethylallyltransferase
MTKQAISEAHTVGRLPILVGGTGLYIRTLLDGIAPVPEIDPAVRMAVRALTVEQSHAALKEADPEAAARLKPADTQRIARALEVVRSTGIPIGEWQRRTEGGIAGQVALHPMILLPPRDWLYARADARFTAMLGQGAVAEVDALMARKLDPALPVMRAIGVREIAAWRAGDIDNATMRVTAATATRQYAKRQYTWFSRQPPPDWERAEMELDDGKIDKLAIKLLNMTLTH